MNSFFKKILASSKRRRISEKEEFLAELEETDQKNVFYEDQNLTENAMINKAQCVEIIVKSRDKQRVVRKTNIDRTQQKEQWTKGSLCSPKKNLSHEKRETLRVQLETFEVILSEISPFITKNSTNFQPNSIEAHR